ncbi:hypothetical protein CTRI78_v008990 [Colletotrichum trifolii]|uniref:DSBA-like thioredoxin domain-containing protein n=1 Tax=Colletotrichum trifolii TaxID=5466 RepID=A0A4R8QVX8_COLTR|nr:hypothetical protein CTRI78_v008990 [Colletotrichum trifolii]
MYNSQITFTLDTICPWTYIAKKRLSKALDEISNSPDASNVSFTLVFRPYQLHSDFSPEPVDKRAWYRSHKHDDVDEKQAVFEAVMTRIGADVGIRFAWGGTMSNTFRAHRVIQHFQEKRGAETANRLVGAIYERYFEQEKDQGSEEVLVEACVVAGIDETHAREVVEDDNEGRTEVKKMMRIAAMDGVDAVPNVVFEGRRRDLTLVGANEVDEYVKALRTIVNESR